jgi:signal transduction histidine kinase
LSGFDPDARVETQQLRRLKVVAILGPLLFLAIIELVRVAAGPDMLRAWPGYVLIAGVILIATLFFAEAVFGVIGRMQERQREQNLELVLLHEAGLSITGELDLERVLQRVVESARELGGARYGALSLLGESGQIEAFITAGISRHERERIGPIPQGNGLLSAVITEGSALRIRDLTKDDRSVGFPANHPPMKALLAVPVSSHGRILGSFYLTEKLGAPEFSVDDQRRLERFATQAAIAIDNASLHRQVHVLAITEERERIAHEMHDTVAQVLAYVNAKAQAAQQHLRHGDVDIADAQLTQLADAARQAYADVREDILGLRTAREAERDLISSLQEYLRLWANQSAIEPRLEIVPSSVKKLDISPISELQVLRIIQESLSNIRKHAHASGAWISLNQQDDHVEVSISDDGKGFNTGATSSHDYPRFGMKTMRERAEAIDGSFEVRTSLNAGTTVVVRIPRESRSSG